MIKRGANFQSYPLTIAGSSVFGRYPCISLEKTINMFESQGWLVPYSGYLAVLKTLGLNGRAIYTSNILNQMITVVGNTVYALQVTYESTINPPYQFAPITIGTIATFFSNVTIAENNVGQIILCDGSNLYLYQPTGTPVFSMIDTDFIPIYIAYHNSRFLVAVEGTNAWQISDQNDATFPGSTNFTGTLQTKPDNVLAVVPFPSRGNMIFVFGQNCTEAWFDVGYQLFPYQRNQSFNIDYGCINSATIAWMDENMCWVAISENTGPIIMVSDGNVPEKISTDGIDYLLSSLQHPEDSEGFMYRQDGHIFYHVNFYTDNLSLFVDLDTKKFYHATDENGDYFIAKQVVFLDNQYYFVTKNNGNIYAFDTIYTTYDGAQVPRIRVCAEVKLPSQDFFVVNDLGFTMEQGETDPIIYPGIANLATQLLQPLGTEDGHYLILEQPQTVVVNPRVDLSFSIDGNQSFSSSIPYELNPLGDRVGKVEFWQLGMANKFTAQFRFWGLGRVVATDGIVNIRT